MDWDAQKAIWDDIFTTKYLGVRRTHGSLAPAISNADNSPKVAPSEASLLMTEPYFNLPNLQDVYDQFIFEEYEFQSYYRCTRRSMRYRGLAVANFERSGLVNSIQQVIS